VEQGAEVRSVGPVFTLLGTNVNGVALVIVVKGVDTSCDIGDHGIGKGVVAMFSVHLDDAEVAIVLAIKVQHALHLLVAYVVIIDDEALCRNGTCRLN
jgi:tetrahydromethanopterin S-methyltransferase subunit C